MKYLITRENKTILSTDSIEDAFVSVGDWIATLNLLGVSGVELVVWKEYATGKRMKMKSFYTTPPQESTKLVQSKEFKFKKPKTFKEINN